MPAACALNFDHVSLAQRNRIGPVLCDLLETRWAEVRAALLIACEIKRLRVAKQTRPELDPI
jgi:mRNA interferase MazF